MDNKDKYEEAKMLYQTANTDQKYVLESLFPELKESEDERIRREIMEYITLYKDSLDDDEYKSWTTWLEKQGEQKPTHVLDTEIPFGARDSELQEASYYIPEGFHAEIEGNRVVIKKGEQKPAWSEEDESMRQYVVNDLRFVKELANDPRYVINVQLIEKEIEWMESFKQRIGG